MTVASPPALKRPGRGRRHLLLLLAGFAIALVSAATTWAIGHRTPGTGSASPNSSRTTAPTVAATTPGPTGSATTEPTASTVPTGKTSPLPAATTVTLTLAVDGCDGCTARPVQAIVEPPAVDWTAKTKTIHGGTVSWTLPIRRTHGMSFEINDSGAVGTNAVTNIVVAYRGLAVGDPVSPFTAARTKAADGCWSGTKLARVTLHVQVDRFADTGMTGTNGYNIRPYLITTADHSGGSDSEYSSTYRGSIGNQDAYFCAH